MIKTKNLLLTVAMVIAPWFGLRAEMNTGDKRELVLNTPGLVAFWTFQEEAGQPRLSVGSKQSFPLEEQAGKVARVVPEDGAPFGKYAAHLIEGQWLMVPREKIGPLNFHGKDTQFSVIAWVKREKKKNTPERCEAIAGVWDEPRNQRQYCLFLNLKVNKNHPTAKIQDKVSGHVSEVGGPTPGFKWAYDVAQSKSSVPYNEWVCVGFTYDGNEVRAYYNGVCEEHEGYNPYKFPNGIYNGGEKGSGFKVGVTDELHGKKCNWFAGTIGGISVFNRALAPSEMKTMALGFATADVSIAQNKPNVLLILADDLGVECLSSYGGTSHRTPNLNRLAKEGMRFTHCFSNPLCSPSRAQLLTGRYPFQNGLKVVLHSKNQEDLYLHPSQPSFVRQLKQHGYTTQIVGKWHVALEHKHNTIREFGFDHYQTWQIFGEDGQRTTRYWKPYLMRDDRIIADEIKDRYGPDVDLEVYLDFIKSSATNKTPFFAFYSTYLPHYPWEPTPDSQEKTYRAPREGHKGDPKYFPDMVAYLDKQIGVMLQTLDDLGIADNTLILFMADNGTDADLVHTWGDNKKVAGGKGSMTDRGTHIPLLVRWPGHIQPSSTCEDLVDLSDIFPTLCELTGAKLPDENIHGRSIAPQLLGKPGQPREWIHIQNGNDRQVRNHDYMLNNKGQLRRVVELWQAPATPDENLNPEKEAAARKTLQAVLDTLGK